MTRFDDGPAAGKVLTLARHPLYLRAVLGADGTWDALDLLDDVPQPDDTIHAYRLSSSSSAHICYTEGRRRKGRWERLSRYEVVEPQPDDATLRDTDAWRAWCVAQVAPQEAPPP